MKLIQIMMVLILCLGMVSSTDTFRNYRDGDYRGHGDETAEYRFDTELDITGSQNLNSNGTRVFEGDPNSLDDGDRICPQTIELVHNYDGVADAVSSYVESSCNLAFYTGLLPITIPSSNENFIIYWNARSEINVMDGFGRYEGMSRIGESSPAFYYYCDSDEGFDQVGYFLPRADDGSEARFGTAPTCIHCGGTIKIYDNTELIYTGDLKDTTLSNLNLEEVGRHDLIIKYEELLCAAGVITDYENVPGGGFYGARETFFHDGTVSDITLFDGTIYVEDPQANIVIDVNPSEISLNEVGDTVNVVLTVFNGGDVNVRLDDLTLNTADDVNFDLTIISGSLPTMLPVSTSTELTATIELTNIAGRGDPMIEMNADYTILDDICNSDVNGIVMVNVTNEEKPNYICNITSTAVDNFANFGDIVNVQITTSNIGTEDALIPSTTEFGTINTYSPLPSSGFSPDGYIFNVAALAAGDSNIKSNPFRCPYEEEVSGPRTYNFHGTADSGFVINNEASEDDNECDYELLCGLLLPDLITNITFPSHPSGNANAGETVTVRVTTTNIGRNLTVYDTITNYIKDPTPPTLTSYDVPLGFAPGASTFQEFNFTCPDLIASTHTINSVADANGLELESDETNNANVTIFTCNFNPHAIDLTPVPDLGSCIVNETYNFTFRTQAANWNCTNNISSTIMSVMDPNGDPVIIDPLATGGERFETSYFVPWMASVIHGVSIGTGSIGDPCSVYVYENIWSPGDVDAMHPQSTACATHPLTSPPSPCWIGSREIYHRGSFTPTIEGDYNITIMVDSTNNILELESPGVVGMAESNNRGIFTVNCVPPNETVDYIPICGVNNTGYYNSTTGEGTPFDLSFGTMNRGSDAAMIVSTTNITIPEIGSFSDTVSPLNPGDEQWYTYSDYKCPRAGMILVPIFVDYLDNINESEEGNNNGECWITCETDMVCVDYV